MKIARHHTVVFVFLFFFKSSFGQGKVLINEFMPWAKCNTTSEFIELMNFGPGPMDIGCYIVTNGTYSVTIPPNTILQKGQYFILSGEDVLAKGCGNEDSLVRVNLNWTNCNCTNVPIPTTGDGFLKDGGNGN
ncbi:MAG: lamin tail domain-containing protein, partial [Flavisolibacter sp.]|nr:lamin tail domain-containing protein [Flavisolibacter sp.]